MNQLPLYTKVAGYMLNVKCIAGWTYLPVSRSRAKDRREKALGWFGGFLGFCRIHRVDTFTGSLMP
jgi:hypothetical protein